MSQLQKVFNYGENPVRTVLKDEEVWFVAKDVCEVLDISVTQTRRLNDKQKGLHSIQTHGGAQQMTIINEAGLYKLIFTSRKPDAEKFTDWVAEEVLPSIRKHGTYMTDDLLEKSIQDPDYMIGLLTKLKEEKEQRRKLEVKTLMLEQQVAEAQPKLTYYDKILKSTKLVTITQIAKDYGLSGQALNKLLKQEGIQYKLGGQWLLYQKYADKGYTKSETHIDQTGEARLNTKWTQKGRLFIHDILLRLGYDPDKKIA